MTQRLKIDYCITIAQLLRDSARQCRAVDRTALLAAAATAIDSLAAELLAMRRMRKRAVRGEKT